jgi:hypothetical protein
MHAPAKHVSLVAGLGPLDAQLALFTVSPVVTSVQVTLRLRAPLPQAAEHAFHSPVVHT